MYVAAICKGQACQDPNFPLIDYNEAEDRCVCRAHPCWDDSGAVHSCSDPQFPYLNFKYETDGTLKCGCSKNAVDVSVHVAKDKCPGHDCEGDHPVLDYVPEDGKCICRSHPCWGDQ